MTGIINSRTCKAKIEKSPEINCKNRFYLCKNYPFETSTSNRNHEKPLIISTYTYKSNYSEFRSFQKNIIFV